MGGKRIESTAALRVPGLPVGVCVLGSEPEVTGWRAFAARGLRGVLSLGLRQSFRISEGCPVASEYFMVMSQGGIRWRRQWARGSEVERAERFGGGGGSVGQSVGGRSGRPIAAFSAKSRSRLRDAMSSLPWEECGPRLAMVTLTYPGGDEWRRLVPDWDTLRRHREAFKEAWRREWGTPKGMWFVEFQDRRRCPHLHLYVGLPESAVVFQRSGLGRDGKERWSWDWALEKWYGIVGSGDPKHRTMGVDVRECWFAGVDGAKYVHVVGDYFWRESGKKGIQKTVPEDFGGSGRFFGMWGLKPRLYEVEVERETWVRTRRMGRTMRRKRARRRIRKSRSMDGLGVYGVDGVDVGTKLLRWDERESGQ